MITVQMLRSLFPSTPPSRLEWIIQALIDTMTKHGITTNRRIAHFLAQTGYESAGFSRLEENLNYTVRGLMTQWPHRFTESLAKHYAHRPVETANYVYANRMGNGPVSSGDGWKHRGFGIIQVTGKINQTHFLRYVGLENLIDTPEQICLRPELATETGGWYWDLNGINELADADNLVSVTKRINGGTSGLVERSTLYRRAKAALTAGGSA